MPYQQIKQHKFFYLSLQALFLNMLSKKTKYAIKALVVLGKNADKPPMQISKIAEEEKIPKKFLEQILLDLRNAGFLYSKKGAGGGYSLNKDAKDIYLVQIMRITDGPIAMVPCASLNFYHKCDECHQETTCGIRDVFIEVRDATVKILSETSIADVISRESTLLLNE
ncbi:transcriptional regulator [Mucilaginibacter xinganensis]|uniref:Transcriptional regulator n=2 Tax=Mucilaginibacter xinganensis TaxID=1234841 RepID=A0A223NXB8_9SPHI|nr:transcriptional regulator [Mucilaginibacter xinganensis]